MSLLLQAAEFHPESNEKEPMSSKPGGISRVMNRIANRKSTPKRPPTETAPPVSESMTNLSPIDDSEDTTLGNFNPIPPPEVRSHAAHTENGGYTLNDSLGFSGELDDAYVGQFRGTEHTTAKPIASVAPSSNDTMKKLDYIIHMIEEQRDHKTGRVAEELVLYSFLGVFVIFTIDSFVKVGRYTR